MTVCTDAHRVCVLDAWRLGRGVSKVPHSPRVGSPSNNPCPEPKSTGFISSRKPWLGPSHFQFLHTVHKRICLLFLFPFQNTTERVKQENFTLKVPKGMREFCVKVLPGVETRNNNAEWSEEQCLRITMEQCEWPGCSPGRECSNHPEKSRKPCLGLLVPALGPELLHGAIHLHTEHGKDCSILFRTILSS